MDLRGREGGCCVFHINFKIIHIIIYIVLYKICTFSWNSLVIGLFVSFFPRSTLIIRPYLPLNDSCFQFEKHVLWLFRPLFVVLLFLVLSPFRHTVVTTYPTTFYSHPFVPSRRPFFIWVETSPPPSLCQ